ATGDIPDTGNGITHGNRDALAVWCKDRTLNLAAREPAHCKLAQARVLADPVEVEPQRFGQFGERARQAAASIEADKLQAAQLLRNVSVRHRLVDHRQDPLRETKRAVDLPYAAFRFHRFG